MTTKISILLCSICLKQNSIESFKKTGLIFERVLMVDIHLLKYILFVIARLKEKSGLLINANSDAFKRNECTVQFHKSQSNMHQSIH